MTSTVEMTRSEALFARARAVMPGGNTRATVYRSPYPTYIAYGAGANVVDVDGNTYLDLDNNFTTLIHGHAFAPAVEALQRQALQGACFGAPTASEVELAELLIERVPHFESIRFMSTGTEAVMYAVKAARAFTGRAKIAKFEGAYHGSYDSVQMNVGATPLCWDGGLPACVPTDAGTPPAALDETVVLPFNDAATCERILRPLAGELAAVLVDPMPSRMGLLPAQPSFLRFLREFTAAHGILLVADEVLNFRQDYAGAMTPYGLAPDLTCIGKVIGGGMPIGAVAGRRDVMAVFDPGRARPGVVHAGTFTANPMSMAAGLAGLRALTTEAFARLNELGAYARRCLQGCFAETGVPGQVTGRGSLFRLHFKAGALRGYGDAYPTREERARMAHLVAFAREHGVLLPPTGLGALSTPMTRDDIDTLVDVVRRGLESVGANPESSERAYVPTEERNGC